MVANTVARGGGVVFVTFDDLDPTDKAVIQKGSAVNGHSLQGMHVLVKQDTASASSAPRVRNGSGNFSDGPGDSFGGNDNFGCRGSWSRWLWWQPGWW